MANRPLTRAEWMAALAEAVDNFDWSGAGEKQWVGLTDEEIVTAYGDDLKYRDGDYMRYARVIEAKLREKNA